MIDALDYKRALLDCQAQCDDCGETGCAKRKCPALIVKKALRKQVPKKVIVKEYFDTDEHTGTEFAQTFEHCPACLHTVGQKYKFCAVCGQALKR